MKIQSVSDAVNFGARVRINRFKKTLSEILDPRISTGSSVLSTSTSGVSGIAASNTVASGLDTVGSAFSAQQLGTNMSGIVPSTLEHLHGSATPETVLSAQNNPSIFGTFFSSLGGYLHRIGKIKINTNNNKIPS